MIFIDVFLLLLVFFSCGVIGFGPYKEAQKLPCVSNMGAGIGIESYHDYFCTIKNEKCVYITKIQGENKEYRLFLFMNSDNVNYQISYWKDKIFGDYLYRGNIYKKENAEKFMDLLKKVVGKNDTTNLKEIESKIDTMFLYINSGIFSNESDKIYANNKESSND